MIHKGYTIRFILHRRKDAPRQHLQMRVTVRGGKPVSFATGLSLTEAEWDPLLGRAKGRTVAAAEANTLIAEWSQVVANIFSHYDGLHVVPTAEQLRRAFAQATEMAEAGTAQYVMQPTASVTLLAAYTQFILDRRGDWSAGTLSAMQSFRRLLGEYRPDVALQMVDEVFMEAFHHWLVEERRQQGVTVHNNLTRFKSFLKWARRKKLYSGTADDYRPKVRGSDGFTRQIVYLTRDELRRLEEFEFEQRQYQIAKDVFLFCCYTGLRTSDVLRLQRADCFNDHIVVTTQKTNHTLTIPLNDKARALLDKYAGCHANRRQKTLGILSPALPATDRKAMNRSIHTMMQMVGIDEPLRHTYYIGSVRHDEVVPKYELITTHTARHTFIVTAISLGIPPVVIMEWTGHKDYNAMRPYIAIAGETSAAAMSLFNTL